MRIESLEIYLPVEGSCIRKRNSGSSLPHGLRVKFPWLDQAVIIQSPLFITTSRKSKLPNSLRCLSISAGNHHLHESFRQGWFELGACVLLDLAQCNFNGQTFPVGTVARHRVKGVGNG
jgi:hypothetical protein